MSAINDGHVNFEISERGIATIEFGHPLSNSLPGKILNKLANTITEISGNEKVKVIVLKSTGDRAFCAGASFDELISIKDFETGKFYGILSFKGAKEANILPANRFSFHKPHFCEAF